MAAVEGTAKTYTWFVLLSTALVYNIDICKKAAVSWQPITLCSVKENESTLFCFLIDFISSET